MNLKEILSVSGKKGLYKLISHEKNRIIAESLVDKSRMPIFPASRPSALDNITVFTYEEDLPLEKIFKIIFQATNGNKIQENRLANDAEMKKYMEEILPQYDKTRVHVSDMKKIFYWYNLLQESDLLSFDDEKEEIEVNTNEESDK